MGARFLLGGMLLGALLALRGRGSASWSERAGSAVVGPWILGSIGLIAIAERHVESGLAALIIGSVPLWVLAIETAVRVRRPSRVGVLACLMGFAGLAIVVGPGGDAALIWVLVLVGAAAFEASGEVGGSHVPQVPDALWATVWQLLGAGIVLLVAGAMAGERPDWGSNDHRHRLVARVPRRDRVGRRLSRPGLAAREHPTSTAATYAYVNPVVALVLGRCCSTSASRWSRCSARRSSS